ncbi:MAG: lipopolysaccharide kinase InaA family protein [Porticoccus sp.]
MAVLLTLQQLQQAGQGLSAPFQLAVPGHETLVCEEVYRHLPGKRLAFRAHWGGAMVLVKLFFQRKYFDRERAGLKAMAEAGVPCPKEVWSLVDDDGGYFLATEFLDDAVSLQDCYQGLSPCQLKQLLRDALGLISQLHRAGWMQADIHLDNFLLSMGVLHVIDGGGIEPLRSPLENLGLFFAQMTPDYDNLVPEVIDAYGETVSSLEDLLSTVVRMREKRIKRYMAKTTRSCSQFEVTRSSGSFVAMARSRMSEKLCRLMDEPEVAVGHAQFLKRGNTATVVKVSGDGGDWVLKRYNIKSFWHGLSRCFRPSRAWISWESAHRLELLGIATPASLAMRENRAGPFRREAYLVTECAVGDNLHTWLLKHGDTPVPEWLNLEVHHLFDILWRSAVSHGDMKATNLIVSGEQLQVIDLDAVRWHRYKAPFVKAYGRDLQRFMDNWQGKSWQHFERLLSPFAQRAGITLINKKV